MLQYILECVAFQLVFLIIYDLFLKRETFFQWNRFYLIGTYVLSLFLPWIKIEAMKTTVPEKFHGYSEILWNTNELVVTTITAEESAFSIQWEYVLLFGGMILASLFFIYKLYQIFSLRRKGQVQTFKEFTQVIISNSSIAFSFFKSIFLGDKVIAQEHQNIIDHELVHIRQKHSYDLLFFEFMRIVGWFNPLVYVYQRRVSELHEFIADAQVAKTNKKEQYEFLLSQVFQTQNISFINQFFKSSLIKKRIVMLQKSKSKKIYQLKYLLLLPLVFGMLAYTSMEAQNDTYTTEKYISQSDDDKLIEEAKNRIEKEVAALGSLKEVYSKYPNRSHIADSEGPIVSKEEYFESALLFRMLMQQMMSDMTQDKSAQVESYSNRIPLPSTLRYESYVSRKKAFQILDENLKFSIMSDEKTRGYDVRQIDNSQNYSEESFELNVANVSDLTGKEIAMFNNKMDEIFKEEGSTYSSLILKDERYRFQVFAAKPIIAINTWPKVSPSIKNEKDKLMNQEPETVPFATIDEVPVFPGCEDADNKRSCFNEKMQKHIAKHFSYPKEAQEKGIQGRVSILFTIAKDGTIQNLRTRGPHKLLEQEVERIINQLPYIKPGVHEGKKVNVPFSIPINFRLQGDVKEESNLKLSEKSDKNPLIVIDGVVTYHNELSDMDPGQIQSINVLKDRHATRKYGEKGKNGVIEIITKKK